MGGSKKRVNSFVKRSMKDESGQHTEADANALLSTIPDLRDGRREVLTLCRCGMME